MEGQNVYQPPNANLVGPPPAGAITERMITALRKTRPWVLFFAIMGFIGSGFMVLAGLVLTVASGFMGDEMGLGFPPVILGLVYLVLAGIYFFPCFYLMKFSGAIKALVEGGGAGAMEDALERQQGFWRLIGILTLTMIAIYFLIIFVAIIFGVLAAAG